MWRPLDSPQMPCDLTPPPPSPWESPSLFLSVATPPASLGLVVGSRVCVSTEEEDVFSSPLAVRSSGTIAPGTRRRGWGSLKSSEEPYAEEMWSVDGIVYVNGVRRTAGCRRHAINACLAPLYSVEGMHIITVEGLGNCQHGLHPVQGFPNPKAIHSSNAVGEPPFLLALAVFFAIKDAVIAARTEEGYGDWFPLDNPATPERIRMACVDDFTKPFANPDYQPKLSV